ncbi:hypothetical protein RvY_16194 [Ramazzottius varieornatus]|uniref:P-type domain-containing protein n=1 Tax=Ramazzottius varieornatus TaxID=947166 RepID=A0A1D1VXK3_RAMVA|nr:hypothetical protein RvY_16194 [Ramazzottius varieornatus]
MGVLIKTHPIDVDGVDRDTTLLIIPQDDPPKYEAEMEPRLKKRNRSCCVLTVILCLLTILTVHFLILPNSYPSTLFSNLFSDTPSELDVQSPSIFVSVQVVNYETNILSVDSPDDSEVDHPDRSSEDVLVEALLLAMLQEAKESFDAEEAKEKRKEVESKGSRNIKDDVDDDILTPEDNDAAEVESNAVCSTMADDDRFDCLPQGDISEASCMARGCCWNQRSSVQMVNGTVKLGLPACFYPYKYPTYRLENYKETANGFEGTLQRSKDAKDIYPNPINSLRLQVIFDTAQRLHVKITDATKDRYEVPLPVLPGAPFSKPDTTLYDFVVTKEPFSFQVKRKSTGGVLVDTATNTFAFYDQFIQISSLLPSKYIYGLGEHTDAHFLHSVNWKQFTMWTTDIYPNLETPLYGVHPFYFSMEEDGDANGVLLFNSNAMDVILQPTPAITYRTIGGVLDFYFFLGPSPQDVTSQYMELLGKPQMPPYWALGYHLCRWGYGSVENTRKVMERNLAAGIPLDAQWNDIDYMDKNKDFTIDGSKFNGITEFVNEVHAKGLRYVVIVDPGISSAEAPGSYQAYTDGLAMNVFVQNASDQVIEGRVWTGNPQAYPDFTHPNISQYWLKQITDFRKVVPVDGLWIDMNEPSNFVDGSMVGCPKDSSLENPPYLPNIAGKTLNTRTLCMTAKHHAGLHYNLHSTYGIYQAKATQAALLQVFPNKRPFVVSRSTFVGQGQYSAHWTGDESSSWSDLQTSIGDILNFNMFGIPFVGADICGFGDNATEELCLRWHQLGAFYPFSRNHNAVSNRDQDPAAWSPAATEAIRTVLLTRYSLLPYYSTLLFRASISGHTVVRPLFFEFAHDKRTYSIDAQFLIGSSVMLSPVTTPNTTKILAYLPEGRWFDFYSLKKISDKGGEWIELDAPLDKVNVHLREGGIVPMQKPEVTTGKTRQNPIDLVVMLDKTGKACGEVYWDDGEQMDVLQKGDFSLVQFEMKNGKLKSTVVNDKYKDVPAMGSVRVVGLERTVKKVVWNGGEEVDFVFNDHTVMVKVGEMLGKESTVAMEFEMEFF